MPITFGTFQNRPSALQIFAEAPNRMSENEREVANANAEEYWKQVNEARRLHESFIPKNKYGNPIPLRLRWGDIMFEEEQRAKEAKEEEILRKMEEWLAASRFPAEVEAQIRKLQRLNQEAKKATYVRNVGNPIEGQFKTDADGKLYRYVTRYWKKIEPTAANYNAGKAAAAPEKVVNPAVGDYKKVKGKVFRWTDEPTWLQVDRKTNYNADLGETFDRVERLGKQYLNARDYLWSLYYPEEAPIYRPARFRRRNTRRANRRTNRRATTRKY